MIKHDFGYEYQISIRKLDEVDRSHIESFCCGNPSIDDFIHGDMPNNRNEVAYIFFDEENDMIIGFGAICCNAIRVSFGADELAFTTNLPSVEIDYFAVDERYRSIPYSEESGKYDTLSSKILTCLLYKIKKISDEHIGATNICLYSVPQAEHFYSRCGFRRFDDYMLSDEKPFFDGCVPMLMEI